MAAIDGPRVGPASGGKARQLVIFAHGYGSNGEDLIGLAPYLAQILPDAAFVAPNAPEGVPGYPSGSAYQWFPLSGTDLHKLAAGVRAAAPSLNTFIDTELVRHGLPPSACALVGFSQGTMMSLHVGPRRAQTLGAVVGLSGLLAGAETLPREILSRPPILLCHGDRDDRVPPQSLFMALSALADVGAPALWRLCGGAGHSIPEEALSLTAEFLHDALAGGFAGWSGPERRV
ncbi:alpha/beta hydrolase [Caulobacter sp. S45]|uniref:alpha/beta hydrolase n=1 Tax=Caulobacter sp. S45 TaxID=1641861 RepID=UPI00131A8EED|nr:prolyl oligopeptidase family serine peptidase [Caulobacter sp. S45]